MKISFSNISFKSSDASNKNKKKNNSLPRYSQTNKYRRYENIVEEVDNGLFKTQPISGKSQPTPYEFCYEKMSFEKENDDVDIFRDYEYDDSSKDNFSCNFKNDFEEATIEDLQYYYQNYDYNDVPLSESLIRQEQGFYETPHIEIDTDITEEGLFNLDRINYTENIIPSILQDDAMQIQDLASEATYFKHMGYSAQTIQSALQRCVVSTGHSQATPYVDLFSFLVQHPNLRPDAVAKNSYRREVFDKNFVNNFKIFEKFYFDNEKDIKEALNLCRTNDNGFMLVNRNLCEILGLLRQKTAQGVSDKQKSNFNWDSAEQYKLSKCVAKNTPLTSKDIELIEKIKQGGELNEVMYDVAKFLLSKQKATVSFVLENIDKFMDRKNEINKVESELREKTPNKNVFTINNIKNILNTEFEESLGNPTDFAKKAILLDITKKLVEEDVEISSINSTLIKLQNIPKHVELNDKFVEDFIALTKAKIADDIIVIDINLAEVLGKMVISSKEIGDTEKQIISILKTKKADKLQLFDLVNNRLNKNVSNEKILFLIKQKIVADRVAKSQKAKIAKQADESMQIQKPTDRETKI